MGRQRHGQDVEGTPWLQLAPGWTDGHPGQLREEGRAFEEEGSNFSFVIGLT
jgi:hypothetical protein